MTRHRWQLDQYCPNTCDGSNSRAYCQSLRLAVAAKSAGYCVAHPVVEELYAKAGGPPLLLPTHTETYTRKWKAVKENWVPSWVFVIVVQNNRINDGNYLGTLGSVVRSAFQGRGRWIYQMTYPGNSVILTPEPKDYDKVMEELEECVHNQEHRLAALALMAHDANITIRQMANDILRDGSWQDQPMPNVPKPRKHWRCLRLPRESR